MTFAFFTVSVHDHGDAAGVQNAFLAAHKDLPRLVDRHSLEQGGAHDLSDNVDRLSEGRAEYIRVEVDAWKRSGAGRSDGTVARRIYRHVAWFLD